MLERGNAEVMPLRVSSTNARDRAPRSRRYATGISPTCSEHVRGIRYNGRWPLRKDLGRGRRYSRVIDDGYVRAFVKQPAKLRASALSKGLGTVEEERVPSNGNGARAARLRIERSVVTRRVKVARPRVGIRE